MTTERKRINIDLSSFVILETDQDMDEASSPNNQSPLFYAHRKELVPRLKQSSVKKGNNTPSNKESLVVVKKRNKSIRAVKKTNT